MTELTAAAPRFHWDARRVAAGVGAALGLALVAFASGGYFPTAWTWAALIALVFVAAVLGLGVATRPSGLALLSLGGLAGFGAWTWLAIVWSEDPAATVLEGLRVLMYISVFTAILLVLRREGVPLLLAATLAAIFLASGYGLLTRLFPERLGSFDPVAAYRLEEPLTYWNAAGVFAAMGALLALGFAARAETVAARAMASATLPVFLATLYFTFSRGAWIAGAVGLAAAVAIDPGRLQLLLTGLVLGIPSGLAVLLSSHEDALTRLDAPVSAASHEGHRLALYILLLAVAAGLAGAGLWLADRRVTPPRQARLAFGSAAALVLVVGLLGVFVHYGGPVELVRKGYDSFTTTSNTPTVNLNQRLFTFSGSYRAELWHAAWHDYEAHPVLGSGPGTYEWYWDEHRPIQHKVRDAHNLYLEVLAELGPLGLLLPHPRPRHAARRRVPCARPSARPARARGVRRVPRPRGRRLGLGDERGHAGGARLRRCAAHCSRHALIGADPLAEAASCRRRSLTPARSRRLRRRRRARARWRPATAPDQGRLREGRLTGAQGRALVALVARPVARAR